MHSIRTKQKKNNGVVTISRTKKNIQYETLLFQKKRTKLYGCNRFIATYRQICYMDVNFNKYSNVSFLAVVCTVFISSKNHIQVLNRSSKVGAALVKTTKQGVSMGESVQTERNEVCTLDRGQDFSYTDRLLC